MGKPIKGRAVQEIKTAPRLQLIRRKREGTWPDELSNKRDAELCALQPLARAGSVPWKFRLAGSSFCSAVIDDGKSVY